MEGKSLGSALWSMLETYQRCLYLNLWLVFWHWVSSNQSSLWPVSQHKEMGSLLLIIVAIGNIPNKLVPKSVLFWCCVSSIQCSHKAELKNQNLEEKDSFVGVLANMECMSLGSTLLCLYSDMSGQWSLLMYKSGVAWWLFCADWSSNHAISHLKQTKVFESISAVLQPTSSTE